MIAKLVIMDIIKYLLQGNPLIERNKKTDRKIYLLFFQRLHVSSKVLSALKQYIHNLRVRTIKFEVSRIKPYNS